MLLSIVVLKSSPPVSSRVDPCEFVVEFKNFAQLFDRVVVFRGMRNENMLAHESPLETHQHPLDTTGAIKSTADISLLAKSHAIKPL